MTHPSHYTITLPVDTAAKLQSDSERSNVPRSTLIAQHLEEYYNTAPAADCEAKIQQLTKGHTAKIQDLENTLKQQTAQHTAEVQQVKAEIQRVQAEDTAEIQRVKTEAANKATSQDLVIKGLQNVLEVAQTEAKNLAEKVASDAGTINELKADKEYFKKQLELVTLRLPAPRVGIIERIFGRKKEK